MKVTQIAVCFISLLGLKNTFAIDLEVRGTQGYGLNASWVQYTGTDNCAPDQGGDTCHYSAEVRAIYDGTTECPSGVLTVNGDDLPMHMRVNATHNFQNIVCSAKLPLDPKEDLKNITLEGNALPVPKWEDNEIVVMGDTGCRLGTSHDGMYQDCNNPTLWPLERVAKSVMESKPDVIIHMGDYIYREGQCVLNSFVPHKGTEVGGCRGSAYYDSKGGVGIPDPKNETFDVWWEDWFKPARYVNEAAPLILIRGNHETCDRAGEGFFRYLHHGHETVCANSTGSPVPNATAPWIVDFKDFQLGIMDTSSNPKESDATMVQEFTNQFQSFVDHFTKQAVVITHYPCYGFGAYDGDISGGEGAIFIDKGMKAACNRIGDWGTIDMLVGSHIHLAEIVIFEGKDSPPAQLVSGNGATQLVAPVEPKNKFDNFTVKQTEVVYQYGFNTMTAMKDSKGGDGGRGGHKVGKSGKNKKSGKTHKVRRMDNVFQEFQMQKDEVDDSGWVLEFKDRMGRKMITCDLKNKHDMNCKDLGLE